jgi:uncharacterized protein (TIGR03437 family)
MSAGEEPEGKKSELKGQSMNLNKFLAYFLFATVALFLMVANVAAQPSLGTAANFAVLGNTTVTGGTFPGTTVIGGSVGSGPTGFLVSNFPPSTVAPPGILYLAASPATALANHDLGIAYNNIVAMGPTQIFPNGDGQLNNQTLGPGVYQVGSAATAQLAAGTLTLDAGNDPGAVFVFQIPGTTLITAGATQILLAHQAQACNVFWQVGSSATLGAASTFVGNILANTSISVGNTVAVDGRLLAGAVAPSGAITLATDTITTTACLPGSIQTVKNTVGGNGTFGFTSNFGVTSLTTVGGTASQTVNNLTPGGSFNVSENIAAGWNQTGAICTQGTPAGVTVTTGTTTICTFTNTIAAAPPPPPTTGSLVLVKNTVGGNGTFLFTTTFGLTALTTLGGTASQTFSPLAPGSGYSLSETVPPGWTQNSAICTNGTPAAVTIVAGVTTTCTFTNTLAAPTTGSITVVKNAVGGNGTFAFTSNFGLASPLTTVGGTVSQTVTGLTAGGSYNVSETVPSGWTQTSASCTNGTPAAIIVTAGATTTCTITNTIVPLAPVLTITKSHVGNFTQGDTGDTYTLTVRNAGPGPTTGAVTASDILPAGLTATAISGTGWTCTLATLSCTRSDVLAAGASYPVITVTVNVANTPSAFPPAAGSPVFQTGDLFISMADGTVQWWREPWMEIKVLPSATTGEAKGMAFDTSNNLYVSHWYATNLLSGNDVATFNQYGNSTALFGSGYNCNPSSVVFDNGGNAYVGQADCSTNILKFDPLGNPLAQYTVLTENRGTYDIALDNNQCTMYYTSEGQDVLRFNVCTNAQMSNFNAAPLPDPVAGAIALVPGGGMLIANSSVITSLDGSGNFVRTYGGFGNTCWLGVALDPDGVSFWASDWCASSVTRFNIATGNVIETHVVSPVGYMVKRIALPKNIFTIVVTNTATVAGGGELTVSNPASDVTTINPPAPFAAPATNPAGTVNAASYRPMVAAGSVASVFGSNLSVGTTAATTMPLPNALASASLQIGGQTAPLFYASPSQVNVQIPWALAGQSQAGVIATVGTMTSVQEPMNIAPFAPGIFTLNLAGSSQGAVMLANTVLFAAPQSVPGSQPVNPGQVISIYCTGLGTVSNQPATGTAAPGNPLSSTPTTPTVTIGGIAAQVSFSGLAPGFVGLYQVNVQVPSGTPAGSAVPLILSIGGVASNTVTIAVQ